MRGTTITPSTSDDMTTPRRLLRWVAFGLGLLATISAAAALPVLLG